MSDIAENDSNRKELMNLWGPDRKILLLAMALIPTGASRAQIKDTSVQAFYESDQVQTVHLDISRENRQKMLSALPKRVYVPATFRWRDLTVRDVGVRFKGNSSSNPRQPFKRSYLVKFDEYKKRQRFLGLRRVSFDNGIQFGSLFSETIVVEILTDLGITTHRANHARVFVNGKFEGVYVNVERIDEVFLENRLGDPNAALYKVDEGGPGCNLQFLGPAPGLYRKAFEAKSPTAETKRGELVRFIQQVNQPEKTPGQPLLKKNFRLDEFIKIMPVMLFAGAFDQLTGWNPHNYYLFQDSKTGQWRYLPWDLDVGFSARAFGRIEVLEDWHAAWPTPPTSFPAVLPERIVADPQLLNQYRTSARDILEKYFEPKRLCRILDEKYERVREDLKKDPFPHRRVTNPSDRSYDDIIRSMKEFIHARYKQAKAELDNPGPRPKKKPRSDKPMFPPWVKPRLAKKLIAVQNGVRALRRTKDLSPVHEVMRKVGPLVQQRKVDEAEKLVDEALRRMDKIRREGGG